MHDLDAQIRWYVDAVGPPVADAGDAGRTKQRPPMFVLAAALIVGMLVGALAILPLRHSTPARQPVSKAEILDGPDIVLFLTSDVTPEQRAAIERGARLVTEIASIEFVDRRAAYEEFRQVFHDEPEIVEDADPRVFPESYRIYLVDPGDREAAAHVQWTLMRFPGVAKAIMKPGE